MQYRTQIKAIARRKRLAKPKESEVLMALGAVADTICRANVIYYETGEKLAFAGPKQDLRIILALVEARDIVEAWYAEKDEAKQRASRIAPPAPGSRRGPWVEAYKSAHYAADLLDQVFSGKDVPNILERLEHQANCVLGAVRLLKWKHGK